MRARSAAACVESPVVSRAERMVSPRSLVGCCAMSTIVDISPMGDKDPITRAAIEAAGDIRDLWIVADDDDRPKLHRLRRADPEQVEAAGDHALRRDAQGDTE